MIKKIISIMILIILTSFTVGSLSYAKINDKLIDNMLEKTNSKIEEYGLNISYSIGNGDKRLECINFLKNMNLYDSNIDDSNSFKSVIYDNSTEYSLLMEAKRLNDINMKEYIPINKVTINNSNTYCRQFKCDNLYGYVEAVKVNQGYKIYIYIQEESNKNNIEKLKIKVFKAIGHKLQNFSFNQYFKAKTGLNVEDTNKILTDIIKNNGATNISTIKINNGYSTVAYTKRYDYIVDNGKLIDLNYAVCKYSSDNYIIIGNPIINVTY